MKRQLVFILTLITLSANSQTTGELLILKPDQPTVETEHRLWLFVSGIAFTSLGAMTHGDWNGTPGEKGMTYGAIAIGAGLITGSVVFDISNHREKKKILDP